MVRSGCLTQEQTQSQVREMIGLEVDPKRIIPAPDCGLAMLKLSQVQEKTANIAKARDVLRVEFSKVIKDKGSVNEVSYFWSECFISNCVNLEKN